MKITEHRTKEILNWLDDHAADHALMFEEMAMFRDAAALIRQQQAAEQAAWHAGLDAGREQGIDPRLTARHKPNISGLGINLLP